jgi:hypothetical protein
MIVGERILEVSGNKVPGEKIKGLDINIAIDEVKKKEGKVEITYVYTAKYEGAGEIKIKGMLLTQEEKKLEKEILDLWKKKKRIPDDYATAILRALNYSGSANGTLVARVLGLTAPLIPPKIQLTKSADK